MSNNLQRVLFAAVAIPLALGIVWQGGVVLALLVAVVAALGARELFVLAEHAGVRPLRGLGVSLAVVAPLGVWLLAESWERGALGALERFPPWLSGQWPLLIALAPALVLTVVLLRRGPGDRPLESAAVTLFGAVYCGVLPSAILLIRSAAGEHRSWPATWLVFFPLAVTWLCDSFAMWGGKLVGGPRLAPAISPGKTRAGAVAGLLGGVLTAVAYVPLALAPAGRAFPLPLAAAMGGVIACTAQVGDLAESLLKREAGVKDSSGLIPGHGGILDRFDSLYFVLPVCALLFRAFGVL